MYINGKEELYTARMNPARSMTLFILGGIFIVLGIIFALTGFVIGDAIIFSSTRKQIVLLFVILVLLFLEMGGSAIMNGAAFRAVVCTVYNEGICGTSANINSLCGLFTKTKAFDINFSDISLFRLENNVLLIQTRTEEYRFQFRMEDSQKIIKLLTERCGN